MKIVKLAVFMLVAGIVFAQTDLAESTDSVDTESDDATGGSVPLEMLRPRREEQPRYPVDIIIGPMGQGDATFETYSLARNIASALFAGNVDAPVLASMERLFLEDYAAILDSVNPRSLRIGGGRESPDGSVSFLVRFLGREFAVTGELFVRQIERPIRQAVSTPPPPPVSETETETVPETETELEEVAEVEAITEEAGNAAIVVTQGENENKDEEKQDLESVADADDADIEDEPAPVPVIPTEIVWVFDDLILESPRNRDEENQENRQSFGFGTYHRLF